MIYVSTTQSSTLITTTPQNRLSLATNNFTWKITNRDSFVEYTFAPENYSNSLYYASFTLSVGTPTSSTGSNVVLNLDAGEYHYSIYQTTNPYDLTLTSSLGLVEVGILIVDGTSSTPQQFTASNQDTVRVFKDL